MGTPLAIFESSKRFKPQKAPSRSSPRFDSINPLKILHKLQHIEPYPNRKNNKIVTPQPWRNTPLKLHNPHPKIDPERLPLEQA